MTFWKRVGQTKVFSTWKLISNTIAHFKHYSLPQHDKWKITHLRKASQITHIYESIEAWCIYPICYSGIAVVPLPSLHLEPNPFVASFKTFRSSLLIIQVPFDNHFVFSLWFLNLSLIFSLIMICIFLMCNCWILNQISKTSF